MAITTGYDRPTGYELAIGDHWLSTTTVNETPGDDIIAMTDTDWCLWAMAGQASWLGLLAKQPPGKDWLAISGNEAYWLEMH